MEEKKTRSENQEQNASNEKNKTQHTVSDPQKSPTGNEGSSRTIATERSSDTATKTGVTGGEFDGQTNR